MSYAQTLVDNGAPVVLAGDFNVMPTELDVYAPERWVDRLPEVRAPEQVAAMRDLRLVATIGAIGWAAGKWQLMDGP